MTQLESDVEMYPKIVLDVASEDTLNAVGSAVTAGVVAVVSANMLLSVLMGSSLQFLWELVHSL